MTEQTTQLDQALTTETWKQWEGHTVNEEFPLYRYLGGSDHSAVFLTSYGPGEAQPAAIKLVPDEPGTAGQQLHGWEVAAGLSHPHLLRIFQTGRCQIDGIPLLYVVTECAEEDLSQILPQRALTPAEAREMLKPALDALAYLHGMGLAHGRLKPANILARADQVKLSIDGIRRAGDVKAPASAEIVEAYEPPERKYSAAADAWSLGMTLVEALTQKLPAGDRTTPEAEPVVPETLPEPFLQVARKCLRRNPALRLKAADIAARLENLPPQEILSETAPVEDSSSEIRYGVWVVAICLFLSAITATAIRMRHQHGRRNAPPIAVEKRPAQKSDGTSAALTKTPVPAQSQPQKIEQTLRPQKPLANTETIPVAQPVRRSDSAASDLADGEIHQVLPDIPQKARDTIHGTVRVSVKVNVDAAGRVTQAELDSAGPSRYFANLAVQAAQKWTFGAAKGGDSAALRAWTVHFAFTPTDTKARAVPEVR